MKLATAVRRFEEQLRSEGKCQSTRDAYLRDLGVMAVCLGRNRELKSIKPHQLTRYLNSKAFTNTDAGRLKKAISLNRSKSAIRTFFRFTVDADYVKRNPARLVRLARTQPKPPRPMSDADVKKLFSVLRRERSPLARRDEMMFALMLGTGIRLGSLVALDASNVNLSGGSLRIRTKGDAEQIVYVSTSVRKQLRRHVKGTDDSTALFQTQAGRRLQPRQVQLRFSKWLNAAGVQQHHTVHSLRHTFGTRLYEQTQDLRLVQRALGHRHVGTTEVYTRISEARLKRELRRAAILG